MTGRAAKPLSTSSNTVTLQTRCGNLTNHGVSDSDYASLSENMKQQKISWNTSQREALVA
jgi:hypothetical protein